MPGMASAGPKGADDALMRLLRGVGLILAAIGAIASVALMIRAGARTPRFLLVLFIGWLLAPFVVLLWAHVVSPRWSVATRMMLFGVTLIVAAGSPAIYGEVVNIRPRGAANAFPWVIVPPATLLLIAIALSLVALANRRRYRRNPTV